MAKRIIVLRGTVTAHRKITKGDRKGELEKVTLSPGDPVGTLISAKEKKALIEAGTLGHAEDYSAGDDIDTGDLAGELKAAEQKLEDANTALAEAEERAKSAEAENGELEKRAKEAESLAAKAGEANEQLEKDLEAAKAEIAELKKAQPES